MKPKYKHPLKRSIIVSLLMVSTGFYIFFISHGEAVPLRKTFSIFPKKIDGWIGREEFFDEKIYKILGVDDSILISYHNSDGKNVQLYTGYYHSQREGDIIHSPKNCMPGSGWNIIETSFENLTISGDTHKRIRVIKLILEKGISKQVALYWFQSRGRFISSEYWQKIYLVWDAIFKNRTDGSFVRLIAPVQNGDVKSTTEYLKLFAENMIPILGEYLPEG